MKPITCNETATFERRTVGVDPEYGTPLDTWEVIAARYWVEAQDVLPSRGESVENGLRTNKMRTRLRMRSNVLITNEVRVTLHSKGERVMQVISGPALMDDRVHSEYMLESYE